MGIDEPPPSRKQERERKPERSRDAALGNAIQEGGRWRICCPSLSSPNPGLVHPSLLPSSLPLPKADSSTMFWIPYSPSFPKPVIYSIFYLGSSIHPESQFRNYNAFSSTLYIHLFTKFYSLKVKNVSYIQFSSFSFLLLS